MLGSHGIGWTVSLLATTPIRRLYRRLLYTFFGVDMQRLGVGIMTRQLEWPSPKYVWKRTFQQHRTLMAMPLFSCLATGKFPLIAFDVFVSLKGVWCSSPANVWTPQSDSNLSAIPFVEYPFIVGCFWYRYIDYSDSNIIYWRTIYVVWKFRPPILFVVTPSHQWPAINLYLKTSTWKSWNPRSISSSRGKKIRFQTVPASFRKSRCFAWKLRFILLSVCLQVGEGMNWSLCDARADLKL